MTLILAFKLAARELRAGISGFYIFLASLALGTAAISAAGTAASMFTRGVDSELGTILGGDVQVRINRQLMSDEDRSLLDSHGDVSEVISVSSMVEAPRTGIRRLVDLRGVDEAYPLYGAMEMTGAENLSSLQLQDGVWGVAPSDAMATAFRLEVGDRLVIGSLDVELRAISLSEPDDDGIGFDFTPRVTLPLAALLEAGLIGEGALYTSRYRVRLDEELSLDEVETELDDHFEDTDWRITTREELGDRFEELLGTLAQFLAIAGMAALIVGGLGVSQAVSAFLATRIASIAILKTMGAGQGLILNAYLLQVMVMALVGVVFGAVAGALIPLSLAGALESFLPLPSDNSLDVGPIIQACLFGLLIGLIFALPSLGRARMTPPSALLGGAVRQTARMPWLERGLAVLLFGGFIGLAMWVSPAPQLTGVIIGGTLVVFILLMGLAWLIRWLARRLSQVSRGPIRIMLSNLAGPASVAPIAAPALGLGLGLLAFVTLVQTNLVYQLQSTAPANAPSLVVAQIPHDQAEVFDQLALNAVVSIDDPGVYRRAPILFARITHLEGVPVEEAEIAESERWIVRGETTSSILPERTEDMVITDGDWWSSEPGPLQVSIEDEAARGLGLAPGDTLTVRILGRSFEAKIANLREVDWGGFGVNVPLIFSPGTLEAANPSHTAIIRSDPDIEDRLISMTGDEIPSALIIPVRERLETASEVFEKASRALSLVSGVVILAGGLVMAGAFATAARKRVSEAALLKTMGLTPAGVLQLYAAEFMLVGVMAAAIAGLAATSAAYPVITIVFEAEWNPDFGAALWASLLAIAGAGLGGVLTARMALSEPAARALRKG